MQMIVTVYDDSGHEVKLPPREGFGAWLKDQARAANLSLKEVADAIGVTKQAASQWATGQTRPSVDNQVAMLEFFKSLRTPAVAVVGHTEKTSVTQAERLDLVDSILSKHAKAS